MSDDRIAGLLEAVRDYGESRFQSGCAIERGESAEWWDQQVLAHGNTILAVEAAAVALLADADRQNFHLARNVESLNGLVSSQVKRLADADAEIARLREALERQINSCDGDCDMCKDARAALAAREGEQP